MFLIVGGSGSGKSDFAEKFLCEKVKGKKIYLATMTCHDSESRERILKHRKKRSGKGFVTVEKGCSLGETSLSVAGEGCLLECLGNLVANEMYSHDSRLRDLSEEAVIKGITREILIFSERFSEMGIVGNDVLRDIKMDPETEKYKRILGGVMQNLSKEADTVIEVVYGIPVVYKGEL